MRDIADIRNWPLKYRAPCKGCRYLEISKYGAECTYFKVNDWPEMPFIHRYALNKNRPSMTTRKHVEGRFEDDARQDLCAFFSEIIATKPELPTDKSLT